jgi:hypothetical protein
MHRPPPGTSEAAWDRIANTASQRGKFQNWLIIKLWITFQTLCTIFVFALGRSIEIIYK